MPELDFASLGQLAVTYIGPLLIALIVFTIGRLISTKLSKAAETGFNKAPNANPTLSRFFASLIRYILLFMVIMITLGVLGIDTTAFGGMVLGLGTAMAFILKDSLADLAAGVMLVLMRPFSVGDEVEIDGTKGVVLEIGLLATRMKTRQNIEIIVANGKAWGGVIRNHNALEKRRLDMVFGVSYDADIDKAIAAITGAAAADVRVYKEPAPWAKVVNLGDSSVDIELRMWCDYNDHRALKVSISQPIKAALDKAGIGIPYPHEVKKKIKVKSSKARDRIAKLNAIKNT